MLKEIVVITDHHIEDTEEVDQYLEVVDRYPEVVVEVDLHVIEEEVAVEV